MGVSRILKGGESILYVHHVLSGEDLTLSMNGNGGKYSYSLYLSGNWKISGSPGTSPLMHSCRECWPWIVSFTPIHPRWECWSYKWLSMLPRQRSTSVCAMPVLLSFQMDMTYDLSSRYKNGIFMMDFWVPAFHLPRGWSGNISSLWRTTSPWKWTVSIGSLKDGLKDKRAFFNPL